jgi:hypothetical protein
MPDAIVIVLNVALLFLISWRFWNQESSSLKKFFWPALVFKVGCGFLLGLLYKYYYTEGGDTFSLFHDGTQLSALARSNWKTYFSFLWMGDNSFAIWNSLTHQEYRSVFVIKWISLFNLLTNDNYWLTSIYFSFLSFMGAWYLSKKINLFFPESHIAITVAFLFFPSVIFWSSGVSKEALAIPGLFILAGIFLKIWHQQKLTVLEWLLCLISIWCVWRLKYFYLALFLPIGITTLLTKYFVVTFIKKERLFVYLLTWFGFFGVLLILVSFLHPNFSFSYLPEVIVANSIEYIRLSRPDNLIHFNNLKPDFISIIANSPKALFSGVFRPFLWEGNSVLKFLSATENLILLVLLVSQLIRLKGMKVERGQLITFAVIVYSVLLCVFLALSSPNLGTLVRYRIGFLPFFVFVLVYQNPLINYISGIAQRFYLRLVRKS